MKRGPRDPRTAAIIARIVENGDGREAKAIDTLCLDWMDESEGAIPDGAASDLECILDAVVGDAKRDVVVAFVRIATYFENTDDAGREKLRGAFEQAFERTSDFTTLYFVAETLGRELPLPRVAKWIERAMQDPRDHAREAAVRACVSALRRQDLTAEVGQALREALRLLGQDASAIVREEARLQGMKLPRGPGH